MTKLEQLKKDASKVLAPYFEKVDAVCEENSRKVMDAFHKNQVTDAHFGSTTGYGYDDLGRDTIDQIFADVLESESAIVRSQFISGTHALTVALFGILRPNDILLSISGKPYDTLDQVIGFTENPSSLASFGVKYEQIDLVEDDFDYEKIASFLQDHKVKMIEIQRSKGYSTRKTISLSKIEKVVKTIREVDSEVIIMVDNCYCEFVSTHEPTYYGVDLLVGSLIKNLGGGIAPNGAYIAGRSDLVDLVSERLTVPGQGREVGPSLGLNKAFLQGLFFAPSVVASSVKTAIYTSYLLEGLGYQVEPTYQGERSDIVQNIFFGNREDLIAYCEGIQAASPINAHYAPVPSSMPGYDDEIIMAAGAFTQGSSIELSCDGPLREPYIAYQQGSLTFPYGKIAVEQAIEKIFSTRS